MIIGLLSAMDRTATVYIARGEFQRAEILQRASRHPGKGVQSHFSTGLLAVIQGKFQEGRNALVRTDTGWRNQECKRYTNNIPFQLFGEH